jgi:RNA polymerase sigma factor (sigma-70 family)
MYYKQAGVEDADQAVSEDLTPSQYRAAELGYYGLLRRKGMGQFLDRDGEDLLQQACFEYTRMIRAGKEVRKPVAWIVLCAWSRTKRILEQPNWRPGMVSTERVGEVSGEAMSAPEEDFLTEDRYRKVREAVEQLPEYQRELLSVSYFEGISVREAARKLDWTPSKAQRAHEAAQRGLHRLLGVETSDQLEIAAGLAAFLSFGPDGCDRIPQLVGGFEAAFDRVTHHLHHLAERGLELIGRPFAHGAPKGPAVTAERAEALGDLGRRALAGSNRGPVALAGRAGRRVSDLGRRMFTSGALESTTAAADGGARVVETCKAIAAVCLISGGAIAGGSALIGSGGHQRTASPRPRPTAASQHKPKDAQAQETPESRPIPLTVPTAPQEREPAPTTHSASRSESSGTTSAGGESRTTRAQRHAQQHQSEESTAESTFEAGQIAAAEEEERRSSSSSSATSTSTESTLSDSGSGTESTATAPASPKVQAEEKQTKTQFQGGLP